MMTERYDVLNPDCPSRRVMNVLSDKWVLLILIALHKYGTLRNGELRRTVGEISQKMLVQTVRELETLGLVVRVSYNVVPPHVEYSLTELGHSLMVPIRAFSQWAEAHATLMDGMNAADGTS